MQLEAGASLVVDGIRRTMLFFPSGGDRLYGSIYAASDASLPPLVLCPSWGRYLVRSLVCAHRLALGVARAGGSAMVYHPPGMGDSSGDPTELGPERLVTAAADAARTVRAVLGRDVVVLSGIRLGALTAGSAWAAADASAVLLLQALSAPEVAAAEFAASGAPPVLPQATGLSFSGFAGPRAAVHLSRPPPAGLPADLERIEIPGDWRREGHWDRLIAPLASWLGRAVGR